MIETLTSTIEDRGAVDIILIYTDFAKALILCHIRVISKVNALDIKCDILQWIQTFLSNRRQRVVVEKSDITQGTVLGTIRDIYQ